MQGGAEGGGVGQGPPGTVTITLSPQDQQAINRVSDPFFVSEKFSFVILILVTRYGF